MSDLKRISLKEAKKYVVWVKKSEKKSNWTIRDYDERLEEFIRYLEEDGVGFVEEVTPRHIRHFIQELDERGLSEVTINGRLRYIRAFFNLLENDELVEESFKNPMKGIKLRKELAESNKAIPDDILDKLLKLPDQKTFLGKRNYVCMLLILGTGIRPSEMFALNVDDWQDSHIIVRAEVAKGRKRRILPLSSGVVKELYKYMKIRGNWGGALLFPSQEGGKLNTNGFRLALKKLAEQGGLNKDLIHPYALRHTFAINFLKAGGDVFKLQRILGHKTLEMTKRYVQWTSEDLQEDYDRMSPAEKFIKSKKRRRW